MALIGGAGGAGVFSLLLAGLAACNALTGVGDLDLTGGSSGGPNDGILRDDAGRPIDAAGLDGGSSGDGGAGDIVVTPTLAACGEQRVCLPSTKGWVPAAFPYLGFGPAATCPLGWPTKTPYQREGSGGCTCLCTANGSGSCAGPIEVKNGPACSSAAVSIAVAADGGCAATQTFANGVAVTPKPSAPPATCGGQVANDLDEPMPSIGCTGAAPIESTACGGGEICVPKPSTSVADGVLTCIQHDGEVECPTRLPFRVLVGSSIDDRRTCSPSCSCKPNGCNDGRLEVFENNDCSGNSYRVTTDGTCKPIGATQVQGLSYQPGTGCGVDQPAKVEGTQVITGARTFCCAFPFSP